MATIAPALDGVPSLFSVAFDLASVGYAAHEHVVTGTAESYVAVGDRGPDGRWEVAPSVNAAFATRLVVYRPADLARANGTVIVEWLNVTGGLDVPALWMATHRHLVRDGYTWVGVSTQRVGIEGGGMMPGLGLRDTAPERYAELHHPGDAYAFDIFTQVGDAIRTDLRSRFGLEIDRVLATGASQSAFYLTTYVNAIDARAGVYDGFLLQGRAGTGVPLEGWDPIIGATAADAASRRGRLSGRDRIRDDTRVPVMVVQSETDVLGTLGYLPARQPDSDHFRLWEVAGAAHCDTYFLCASPNDSGLLSPAELAALIARADQSGMPTEVPINSGPQIHYVLQRAFDALNQWTRGGGAPAPAARLDIDGSGGLAVDGLGVGCGGVRTPWVDVPTTVLSGLGQPGFMTELFGTTRALDEAALRTRYPRGRDDYISEFRDATRVAVDRGFLLAADAEEIEGVGAVGYPL